MKIVDVINKDKQLLSRMQVRNMKNTGFLIYSIHQYGELVRELGLGRGGSCPELRAAKNST